MFLKWLIENDRSAARHDYHVVFENGNHDEIDAGYTHLRAHKILADYGLLKRTDIVEHDPRLLGPFKGTIWVAAIPSAKYQGDEINFAVGALRKKLDAKLEAKQQSLPGVEPPPVYFVAMVHEAIAGVSTEGGYQLKRGPTLDPGLPVTYWALGDIHMPFQRVLANAYYAGSPIQHDFGDLDSKRGVLIVDLTRPCEPNPFIFEGITPLITVSEVPKEWPEDAIVRFEGTAEEMVDVTFPDNVVGFKPVVSETIRAVVETGDDDMLDGLSEALVDQQVPEDLQPEVVEAIRSAIKAI